MLVEKGVQSVSFKPVQSSWLVTLLIVVSEKDSSISLVFLVTLHISAFTDFILTQFHFKKSSINLDFKSIVIR